MLPERVSPVAAHVIAICGGHETVRLWLGFGSLSQVYKFTYAKSRGGSGGRIAPKYQEILLEKARLAGVQLSLNDFHEPQFGGRAVLPDSKKKLSAPDDQKGAPTVHLTISKSDLSASNSVCANSSDDTSTEAA